MYLAASASYGDDALAAQGESGTALRNRHKVSTPSLLNLPTSPGSLIADITVANAYRVLPIRAQRHADPSVRQRNLPGARAEIQDFIALACGYGCYIEHKGNAPGKFAIQTDINVHPCGAHLYRTRVSRPASTFSAIESTEHLHERS